MLQIWKDRTKYFPKKTLLATSGLSREAGTRAEEEFSPPGTINPSRFNVLQSAAYSMLGRQKKVNFG